MKDLFNISGKVAVVTGGSRGIGYMIAQGFVENGARVYISSRKADACEAAARELSKHGECIAIPMDLSSEHGAIALANAIRAREQQLDILVNNAGATWGAPIEEFSTPGWDRVLDINVKGPFFVTRELLPLLRQAASDQDPARIINIGSIGALSTGGVAFSYGPSKAAIHQMTRNWASQFARDRITVNCIAPGAFPSKMMAFVTENEEHRRRLEAQIPMGRIGTPEDIAGLAICLCARAGAHMTGCVIPLDGGTLVRSTNMLAP
ncbi:MAG: SDR family oxidoreductase [Burkholderiaceae bacterium]